MKRLRPSVVLTLCLSAILVSLASCFCFFDCAVKRAYASHSAVVYVNDDGWVRGQNAAYMSAWNSSAGSGQSEASASVFVGQQFALSYYTYRSFLSFNLSAYANCNIVSAVLYINITDWPACSSNDYSLNVFRASAYWKQPIMPNLNCNKSYNWMYYDNLSQISTMNINVYSTANTYYAIPLTADFIAPPMYNTTFVLRTNREVSQSVPNGDERVTVSGLGAGQSFASYLNMTYDTDQMAMFNSVNTMDWGQSMDSLYLGLMYNKATLTDLTYAFGNISASYSPNDSSSGYDGNVTWQTVFRWAATLKKLGITNQTEIQWAIDNATMVNGLPYSGTDAISSNLPYFSLYDCYLLYGYDYSLQYNYGRDKWNLTTAFSNFEAAWQYTGDGFRSYYNTNSTSTGYRYYDEEAETMRAFLIFHEIGAGKQALTDAEIIWNQTNSGFWYPMGNGGIFSYHSNAVSGYGEAECEAGGFLQIAAWLEHASGRNIVNTSRLVTDTHTRFISQEWSSLQWTYAAGGYGGHPSRINPNAPITQWGYACIHAHYENEQVRLKNTIMSWAAILGVFNLFDSNTRQNVTNMLQGSQAPDPTWSQPAWQLLRSANASLYNPSTQRFHDLSGGLDSDTSTMQADALTLLMAMVPTNATLAIPIEELSYEYIYNILDGGLFSIDIFNHNLTLSLAESGSLNFLLNQTVPQSFAEGGTWTLHFARDWNSVAEATRMSDLPSNRRYLSGAATDKTPPTYNASTLNADSNLGSSSTTFSCLWSDNAGLSEYCLCTNNTGTFVNSTWTAFTSGWSNVTIALNSSKSVIQWCFYANDTSGNMNATSWQYFVATSAIPEFEPLIMLPLLVASITVTTLVYKRRRQASQLSSHSQRFSDSTAKSSNPCKLASAPALKELARNTKPSGKRYERKRSQV